MSPRGQAALMWVVGVGLLGVLAGRWGVVGSEALAWSTGEGVQGLLRHLPPEGRWIRAPGLALFATAGLALISFAARPRRFAALALATPALGGQALFATAEGWAVGLWGLALAASLRGGVGHAVAGGLVGLGVTMGSDVASTLLAWPLLAVAALPEDRRTPWPWIGLALAAGGAIAAGARPPDTTDGLLDTVIQQGLRSAPLLGVAWAASLVEPTPTRAARLARWASVPVLGGAALGAAVGWGTPAGAVGVAWWGAALAIAASTGPAGRLGDVGAWLGAAAAVVAAVHVEHPLLPLPRDPSTALHEGADLADDAVRWAMPPGVPRHDPRATEGVMVLTDDPQIAASIRFHTGLPARVWHACGPSTPLATDATPPKAVFVARARDGAEAACTGDAWTARRRQPSPAHGPGGRLLETWVWFELTQPQARLWYNEGTPRPGVRAGARVGGAAWRSSCPDSRPG